MDGIINPDICFEGEGLRAFPFAGGAPAVRKLDSGFGPALQFSHQQAPEGGKSVSVRDDEALLAQNEFFIRQTASSVLGR
ncbi:MAG: hypothetical protein IJ174_05680, partial [Clostridia bacterium]|nr:hypothetical protein [Clostridia bacterium]